MTESQKEDPLEYIHRLLAAGDFARALAELRGDWAKDCPSYDVLNATGLALAGLNRFEEALAAFDEAVQQRPEFSEAHANAGKVLLQLARAGNRTFEEAIDRFKRVLAVDPASTDALIDWGRALLHQQKLEQARWKFEQAIQLGGGVDAYFGSGNVLFQQNRFLNAAERLAQAVELDATRPESWYEWGRALETLGDTEAAVEKFRQALTLDPDFAEAYIELGRSLLQLDRFEEAYHSYLRSLDLAEARATLPFASLRARYGCARALVSLRRNPEALQTLRGIISDSQRLAHKFGTNQYSPEERDVLLQYLSQFLGAARLLAGGASLSAGLSGDAIVFFREAVKADPSLLVTATWLTAATHWRRGEYRETWTELQSLITAWKLNFPEGTAPATEDMKLYAGALHSLGEIEEAERVLHRAIEREPENFSLWADLAALYLEQLEADSSGDRGLHSKVRDAFMRAKTLLEGESGRRPQAEQLLGLGHLSLQLEEYDQAEHFLTRALELDDESAIAHANLGVLYAGEGLYAKAASSFSAAFRRDPDDVMIRAHLGAVYLRLESFEEAESHYRAVLRLAPCNIEAHMGLGEVLTFTAEKDAEQYDEAIFHFSRAEELAQSMNSDPAHRLGSSRLSGKQLAAVVYARGYARVKLYEFRRSEGTLPQRQDWRLLAQAAADFKRALELDEHHLKAQQAHRRVKQWGSPLSVQRWVDNLGPAVVVVLATVVFVRVQLAYPRELNPAQWLLATLGVLLFIIAGFSLSRLLKLNVGGIALERSPVEEISAPTSLGITRDIRPSLPPGPFQPAYSPVPGSENLGDLSEPLVSAQQGAEPGTVRQGPAERAAREGAERSSR